MIDLVSIQNELEKFHKYPYSWGRKQSNLWDIETNFIYNIQKFEVLLDRIKNFEAEKQNYAMIRWYNFWSAMAVENIFAKHKNVEPNKNTYDKLVDFKINNIEFDHKTSVFPKGFKKSFEYAKQHKKELIIWLYTNQSQEGRKHLRNRLFIVLYNKNGNHWKLKSEIASLKSAIDNYVVNFKESNLVKLKSRTQGIIFSDIIWLEKG